MSRLITKGNIAVFEYPKGAINPQFTLESDGVLWIEGYTIPPFGQTGIPIRAMKRFQTNLINYYIVGKYEDAKDRIRGDFTELIDGVDTKNCIVCFKKL